MLALLAALFAIVILLAANELAFARLWRARRVHAPAPIASLARGLGRQDWRYVTGSYTAWWLVHGPVDLRKRIATMFAAAPEAAADPARKWRVWLSVHIPALVILASRRGRAEANLRAIFDGLIDAARAMGERGARFDDVWPIVECLEEVAGVCPESLHDVFTAKLGELSTATRDEVIQAASAWVINELFERDPIQQKLAQEVVKVLANSEPAVRTAVGIMKLVRREIEIDAPAGGAALLIGATTEKVDDAVTKINAARTIALLMIAVVSEKTEFAEAFRELRTIGGVFPKPEALSGLDGLTWMVAQRLAHRDLMHGLHANQLDTIARDMCDASLRLCQSTGTSAFLTIESLEPIRDKAPEACAKAMAAFLASSNGHLDQGIAVCVCEGFEEHEAQHEEPSWFVGRRGAWCASGPATGLNSFWTSSAKAINAAPWRSPLAEWMNIRLELRARAVRAPVLAEKHD